MNTLNETAQGVYLITVTPFKDNGELDLPSTDRMVDFCLERGVTGLTILGIMGEATKLTAADGDKKRREACINLGGTFAHPRHRGEYEERCGVGQHTRAGGVDRSA